MFITFHDVNLRYKISNRSSNRNIMLQYLINTTIIWLACLLIYEVLLRKESFHKYNRIYLLTALAIGLLLPAVQLDNVLPATTNPTFSEPTKQVYEIRNTIQAKEGAISAQPPNYNIEPVLWAIYLLGVLAGLAIIAREGLHLFSLYNRGRKSVEGNSLVVETGKAHSAFSFFNIVFVSSKAGYNEDQWTLLMAHEKEHGRQLHSADNILLLILRILFWFHPLPHIYFTRLRAVHEFQADSAAATDIHHYGTFVLEQCLLKGAPLLTHSFNYSPIKKRIAMLTGARSKRTKVLKYLAVIPLSFMLILFCTKVSFSGAGKMVQANKVYFKGNEIEFAGLKVIPFEYRESIQRQKAMYMYWSLPDTVPMKNWATNETFMMPVRVDTMPVAINGKPVLGSETLYMLPDEVPQYTTPVLSGTTAGFEEYVYAQLKNELDKLEDGSYTVNINRLVINDKGEIAYYENKGLQLFMGTNEKRPVMNMGTLTSINKKIGEILEGPLKFKPALKDGQPINVRLSMANYQVIVKDHKARVAGRGGC